jgi:hypothetical protein
VTDRLLSFIPINQLTILSALAIVGGLYFFFIGFRLLARKRLLLATPTSRIRSAAIGLVEVNGLAAGPYTMPAPITGKPCFLYHTTIWQQRPDKQKEWEKVADETLHLPFFIDDSTGQLLIEPLGANLDLRREYREEYDSSFFSSGLDNVPPRVSVFLARHNIAPSRSLRVEERLIKPEDALFIAGTLTENPGVQVRPLTLQSETPGHSTLNFLTKPAPAPEVIQLSSGPLPTSTRDMSQQAKIAAALTRAGITRPEAWSAAGIPYQSVAVEDTLPLAAVAQQNQLVGGIDTKPENPNPSGFNLAPPVVLMKGTNDPTFVISFRSQKEFVVAIAWKSAAMIWGGAAITLLGVYMLLAQMQLDWL